LPRSDERLTAFLELELAIHSCDEFPYGFIRNPDFNLTARTNLG